MTASHATDLTERAAASAWVAQEEGLAGAVGDWAGELDETQDSPAQRAARVARPGPLPPLRALRYVAALEVGALGWAARTVPGQGLRPLREPGTWAKQTVAGVLRNQLGLLGASGAEIARIIGASEGLLPDTVVQEIRRRPVEVQPFATALAERIARRALGDRIGGLSERPLAATPLSQLHSARLDGDRRVLVRVRRPGASRTARSDARITATVVAPLEWLVPALREPHPLGFVELATRQALEELDLRREALNAAELAMALEELGTEGITVAHPVPGAASRRVLVLADLPGARSFASAANRLDPEQAVSAYVAATLEAALAFGVFHADLRPEHLVVLPDRTLAIVGCGTVGRFDLTTRRAAFAFLTAIFGGDHRGQVEAMRIAGAVPEGVDEDALVDDLAAAPSLAPMAMLSGGEGAITAALRDAVRILLQHRLRPPVEVVLFVRNVFAFREFLAAVAPGMSPFAALMPLVQRLPDLQSRLAADGGR